MKRATPYLVSPGAQKQLSQLAKWWRAHRRDAFKSVRAAFSECMARVVSDPEAGTPYEEVDGVRWVLMHSSMPYKVFYRRAPRTDVLEVIAVWSAMRGSPPPI